MAHPFFDAKQYPAWRPEARGLERLLAGVYKDPKFIDAVYLRCSDELPALNLAQPPSLIWKEALENLTPRGGLRKLCETVRDAVKGHPENLKAIQAVFDALSESPTVAAPGILERYAKYVPPVFAGLLGAWGFAVVVTPIVFQGVTYWTFLPIVLFFCFWWAWSKMRGSPTSSKEETNRIQTLYAVKSAHEERLAARGRASGTLSSSLVVQPPLDVPVISVASGKGGVGKTQIAVALAEAAEGFGQRVLIVDLDLFNRGLSGLFAKSNRHGVTITCPHFLQEGQGSAAVSPELFRPEPQISPDLWSIYYPPLAPELSESGGRDANTLAADLRGFLSEATGACSATLIILDCHGGPDALSFAACALSRQAILVTEPDEVSLHGLLNFIRLFEAAGNPATNLRMIYNKVPRGLTVASLTAVYSLPIAIDPDAVQPSLEGDSPRRSLEDWFGRHTLLMAVPHDDTFIQPRRDCCLLTRIFPWTPLAQKARTILKDLAGVYPAGIHGLVQKSGVFARIRVTLWSAMNAYRRSFLGLNPLVFEPAFFARLIVIVFAFYVALSFTQATLAPKDNRLMDGTVRMILNRAFDRYHWEQREWFFEQHPNNVQWKRLYAFARGETYPETGEELKNQKEQVDRLVKAGASEERAILDAQLEQVLQDIASVFPPDPDRPKDLALKGELAQLVGSVSNPAAQSSSGLTNNGDDSMLDYDRFGEVRAWIAAARKLAHSKEPVSPDFVNSWRLAASDLDSMPPWQSRAFFAVKDITGQQNAIFTMLATAFVCAAGLLAQRSLQRSSTRQIVLRRWVRSVATPPLAWGVCLLLVASLKGAWGSLQPGLHSHIYYVYLIQVLLFSATLLLIVVEQLWCIVALTVEGRNYRELLLRSAFFILGSAATIGFWYRGGKVIPNLLFDPP